jgi:hypothetical protein
MTTKKKDTPNDHGSKDDSFREAQRQEQRARELWVRSSPTMKEMFAAFDRFRASLDDALAAVDGFVSESERVSGELRKEQCEPTADALDGWADEWREVTKPAFHKAATGIVDLVYSALRTGYPRHVLKVETPLLERGLAEWGRLCASQRYVLRTDSPEQREASQPFAAELIKELERIKDQAEGLTVEQVIEAANNRRTTTGEGFAAELACMCGAFKYGPKDQEKAQDAIRKAMRGA